jgi:cytochrome b561
MKSAVAKESVVVKEYGTTAKLLHWLVLALLAIQYMIGWLMPDVHRGPAGTPMIFHMSFGILILALIIVRLIWRITHLVPQESSLPLWQRVFAEGVHWLLYVLVLLTAISGWLIASSKPLHISWFYLLPLPLLPVSNTLAKGLGQWHGNLEVALIILIGCHVAAGLMHLVYYRDRIMHRMLPQIFLASMKENP